MDCTAHIILLAKCARWSQNDKSWYLLTYYLWVLSEIIFQHFGRFCVESGNALKSDPIRKLPKPMAKVYKKEFMTFYSSVECPMHRGYRFHGPGAQDVLLYMRIDNSEFFLINSCSCANQFTRSPDRKCLSGFC